MKLAFFNFKFSTKWIDYGLRELEERGNAQKRTFTILFSIYYHRKIWQTLVNVRILLSWSRGGMHWWHQKGRRGSCNELCDIWVYERHIHKGRRAYLENDKRHSCSHDIIKYRMTQGDVLHCFVVIKYAPRVILKPLPIAGLWETQKFLDLVRGFIKMSRLFCLFSFSANRLKSRWRSPAYYQSTWGATSDQGGNTKEWLGFRVWPTMLKMVSGSCDTVRTWSMVCCAQLGTRKLW